MIQAGHVHISAGILGVLFLTWYLRNEDVSTLRLIALQLLIAVVALLGAKVFSLALRDWQLMTPLIYELKGGWRFPGAVIALIFFAPLIIRWLAPKLKLLDFFDAYAVVFVLSHGVRRIGCVLNGCCVGGQCDNGYCLTYPEGTVVYVQQLQQGLIPMHAEASLSVFPLHYFFMANALLVGVFLYWFAPRKQYAGQVLLLYLFLHEGGKAILENFREPAVFQLQVVSAVLSFLAAVILLAKYLNNRPSRI